MESIHWACSYGQGYRQRLGAALLEPGAWEAQILPHVRDDFPLSEALFPPPLKQGECFSVGKCSVRTPGTHVSYFNLSSEPLPLGGGQSWWRRGEWHSSAAANFPGPCFKEGQGKQGVSHHQFSLCRWNTCGREGTPCLPTATRTATVPHKCAWLPTESGEQRRGARLSCPGWASWALAAGEPSFSQPCMYLIPRVYGGECCVPLPQPPASSPNCICPALQQSGTAH